MEEQISQITALSAGKELQTTIQDLTNYLDNLQSRFIINEREIINTLSSEAAKLKINVKNITPHQKIDCAAAVNIESYTCQELPISMTLTAEFKNFGQYLDILENNLAVLVNIKELKINGQTSGSPQLDILLDLSVYLLKKK